MTHCLIVVLLCAQIIAEKQRREQRSVPIPQDIEDIQQNLEELVNEFMDNDSVRDQVVDKVIQRLTDENHFRIREARTDSVSIKRGKKPSSFRKQNYCVKTKGHGCTSGWKRLTSRR